MHITKSTKRVLVVEDDMIISMVLERMLQKLNFTVIDKVATGKKAIRLTAETEPDIILMDIQLKEQIDRITDMEKIRGHSCVPVIYNTGNADEYYLKRARNTNYVGYLVKPIQMEDLKEALQKVTPEY